MNRDAAFRRQLHLKRFRDYFYGPLNDLNPRHLTVHFSSIGIFRIGGRILVRWESLN